MIQRSHRQKTARVKPSPETLLRLHEQLASQRLWFFRLFIASALALALSFILWLVRVPLTWHLLGIALGFAAGLFVQRPMKTWALAWIRERAGLSYETALEQPPQDDFGFADSLKERAAEEASRLTLPKYGAWWLPMLAVALGLALLPLIPSVTNLPIALTTEPTATTLPEVSNQSANAVEPAEPQTTPPPVAEPPPTGQTPSSTTGETDTSQLNDATGSSNPASSNNQSADEQALDRFLENLRQNEQSSEGAPDVDLSSVMQPGGSRNGQPIDEDNDSRPRSEQTNPFSQAGEEQNSDPQNGEAQQDENQSSQSDAENAEGQEGQAEQGLAQSQEGQENAEGDTSQTAESSQEGAGEAGTQQGEQPAEGQGSQEGEGENPMSAEAQSSEGDSDSGQNAEGAGSLPGTPTEQSTEVVGSSQQNPDFLPGQLSEGPNNIAGTARLPGETEEIAFPEGGAPGSFSRAEEEALTEGRIPLEYQEVIRQYFRGDGQ